MAFIPDEPFPKSSGDDIRAKDWNDLVEELKRLDTAKPDLSGSEWAALLTRPVRIKNLVQSSSRAHKKDISNLSASEAIHLLDTLEPQTFHFKEDDSGRRHLGFVAEDMPNDITTPEKEGFNPTAVIAVLTRIVKEQQQALESLREEVRDLRKEVGKE